MTIGTIPDGVLRQTVGKPCRLEFIHISASEVRFSFATPRHHHFEHTLRRDELTRGAIGEIVKSVERAMGPTS